MSVASLDGKRRVAPCIDGSKIFGEGFDSGKVSIDARAAAPKRFELLHAIDVTACDEVEHVLHVGREVIVDERSKVLLQQSDDGECGETRDQCRSLLPHVTTVQNRGHDRCVRRRAPDTQLLEFRHERRLVETSRWLRRMAFGGQRFHIDLLTLVQGRQFALIVVIGHVLQGGHESREGDDRAGRAEFHVPAVRAIG